MNNDEKSLVKPSDSMSRMMTLSRFDDLFKEVFEPFANKFDRLWNDWDLSMKAFDQLQPKGAFPKVNVVDNSDSYDIEIAIAGFDKDDVVLELKDNALLVKAEKNEECGDEECKNYLRREIAYRSFRRVINFPAEVNPDAITAKYDNGLISVSIGKVIEDKPESIKIELS